MRRKRYARLSAGCISAVLFILFLFPGPALAGPGGFIAKAVVKTFWGKILLTILILFFLPLIIYLLICEKMAERRARRDLAYVSHLNPEFDWSNIRHRILDCFHNVHRSWSAEDASGASEYMTEWYRQNQQIVHLNQWRRNGYYNDCEVKEISLIRPLLFVHRNEGCPQEGSLLVISIIAIMKDCLMDRKTGETIEGDRRFKDHNTLWSFTFTRGKWRVYQIEEDERMMDYLQQVKYLPKIEETVRKGPVR